MFLTEEDLDKFDKATKCHICDKPLGKDRVRDHCHLTGKFRERLIMVVTSTTRYRNSSSDIPQSKWI